jgi:hypothetical protein
MVSCWSCLVILEKGATLCPICGADQTRPVQFVELNVPSAVTPTHFFQEWKIAILVVVVFAVSMGGILWHHFGEANVSPVSQPTAVAAKSLRQLREALSGYVISTQAGYPKALNVIGEKASPLLYAANTAGYRLDYSSKPSSSDSVCEEFVILARPEKSGFPNLRIDESGVVRATEENRPATAQDPPYQDSLVDSKKIPD